MEVFLRETIGRSLAWRFLHTRGGVSREDRLMDRPRQFSPHTWRCFFTVVLSSSTVLVFSTHVEVFLEQAEFTGSVEGFLHTRGGVSTDVRFFVATQSFSPHTWRCF